MPVGTLLQGHRHRVVVGAQRNVGPPEALARLGGPPAGGIRLAARSGALEQHVRVPEHPDPGPAHCGRERPDVERVGVCVMGDAKFVVVVGPVPHVTDGSTGVTHARHGGGRG